MNFGVFIMDETCFVIMPIGDQKYGNVKISSTDLRSKYDNLIKIAISNARPNLEITRSDDIAAPGEITTDILIQLMHSDYVVADITYPNPNVFYELGIRHACRPKTILIKENVKIDIPFDIHNLRYINYENTTHGLSKLSKDLKKYFDNFDRNPNNLDNHFLKTARSVEYKFLEFGNEGDKKEKRMQKKLMLKMLENPKLRKKYLNSSDPLTALMIEEILKSPEKEEYFECLIDDKKLKL